MAAHEWIAILDFGSQYSQLIARRVREHHVYCELLRYDTSPEELARRKPAGIILSGGPASVFEKGAPLSDPGIYDLGIPILGICYGMQMTAHLLGGKVKPGKAREFGHAHISVTRKAPLFKSLPPHLAVWMSHGDQVKVMPEGFHAMAKTPTCPVAAMGHDGRRIYGLQFHPEVVHTPKGKEILRKSSTRRKGRKSSAISFSMSAAAPATGRCRNSSRRASPASARRSAATTWSAG